MSKLENSGSNIQYIIIPNQNEFEPLAGLRNQCGHDVLFLCPIVCISKKTLVS